MVNLQIKDIDKSFYQPVKTPAQVLLELSGGWQDDRDADAIIADLRQSRNNSTDVAEL